MKWLNFADAQRVGIEVKRLNLTDDANATQSPIQSDSPVTRSGDLLASIAEETRNLFGATNKPNAATMTYLQQKYSEQVNYYSKLLPKANVLAAKQTFLQRWPFRNYSLIADSLRVACDTPATCTSAGKAEWSATNAKAISRGSMAFSYGWGLEGGVWKIQSETSYVISRSVSRNGTEVSSPSNLAR
jgi:hypothetical protein